MIKVYLLFTKQIGKMSNNSSKYWKSGNDYGTWSFVWDTYTSLDNLRTMRHYFLTNYYQITHKYGMLLPAIEFFTPVKDVHGLINYIDSISDFTRFSGWIRLSALYYFDLNIKHIYPSLLYYKDTDGNLASNFIIDVPNKMSISTIKGNYFEDVFKVDLYVNEFSITLSIMVNSNVFVDSIWEWKEDRFVDNSELSFLNTPRFNSFLRDLKNICDFCGATKFEYYPRLEKRYQNEYGFLLKNEIIYYEDLYDLLPEEQKYKPFEKDMRK